MKIKKRREKEKRNAGERRKMQIEKRRQEPRKCHITRFKTQMGKNLFDHEVASRLRRYFNWSHERHLHVFYFS
jgi:hypothetical protein